jgi:glycolate oxidase FAD binding subunit
VLRLEGTPDEIAYQRERCAVLAPGASFAEASSRRSPILMRDDEGACVRIGVLPDRAIAVARRLHEECSGDGIRIAARLGDGTLRVCARLGSDADAIAVVGAARRVAASEGTAVVERLPAHLKSDVDVWGAAPAGFALMREVKRRFDPDGILAPGRFVGGL